MWNFERVLDAITNAVFTLLRREVIQLYTAINDSKNWCLQQR